MPKEKMQTPGMEMGGEKTEKSKDARILAAIGYLWILCLLPLLGKRESEFAQFHGKQGLVLTIVSFVIIWMILDNWIPAVIVGAVIHFIAMGFSLKISKKLSVKRDS